MSRDDYINLYDTVRMLMRPEDRAGTFARGVRPPTVCFRHIRLLGATGSRSAAATPRDDLSLIDPLETLSTGSLEEGGFDNVAVFEYMNLRGSAYQFDADRPHYLCRAGWELPFLACAWA